MEKVKWFESQIKSISLDASIEGEKMDSNDECEIEQRPFWMHGQARKHSTKHNH